MRRNQTFVSVELGEKFVTAHDSDTGARIMFLIISYTFGVCCCCNGIVVVIVVVVVVGGGGGGVCVCVCACVCVCV